MINGPLECQANDLLEWANSADVAFQPIVSAQSLRVHGFEALSRLAPDAPFADIGSLLDAAADKHVLQAVERTFLTKAISKFSLYEGAFKSRLFCNIDNRLFDDAEASPAIIIEHVKSVGLRPSNLCIELSERVPPESEERLARLVEIYQKHNVRIAIDDFGRGFSGLETLMLVHPHYVKIDQAFIRDIHTQARQQAIVDGVVRMAHSLGLHIVAEGVEQEDELRILRELGCDFIQGFLIARPSTSLELLRGSYASGFVKTIGATDIAAKVSTLIDLVAPLRLAQPVAEAVTRFKSDPFYTFLPVVDEDDIVHGAIYKEDMRALLFGEFGTSLLTNRGINLTIDQFVRRCPMSEAGVTNDALVDSYMTSSSNEGIVLIRDARYVGILDNLAMLRLTADRAVAVARDQNPLTFLPGNNLINQHVQHCLDSEGDRCFAFFDFDNFKAFNDTYGFEQGDRALLMFSEKLTKFKQRHEAFVGHIGGDDFFASLPLARTKACEAVIELMHGFKSDVESLYNKDDREAGGITAEDRYGQSHFFPMLRASTALLPLNSRASKKEAVLALLATGKSRAKAAESGLVVLGAETDARGLIDILRDAHNRAAAG